MWDPFIESEGIRLRANVFPMEPRSHPCRLLYERFEVVIEGGP